eukprot:jgi/Chlat1/4664/Chrsp3S00440
MLGTDAAAAFTGKEAVTFPEFVEGVVGDEETNMARDANVQLEQFLEDVDIKRSGIVTAEAIYQFMQECGDIFPMATAVELVECADTLFLEGDCISREDLKQFMRVQMGLASKQSARP